MKCKFCQAEMEEGVTLCPACGKENGETKNVRTKKKLTANQLAVVYICVLAVVAVFVAGAIVGIRNGSFDSAFASLANVFSAKGNEDDVTCKNSYTVSDRKAVSKGDTVIATAGNGELTNAQLQIHYWLQVYNFIGSYGSSASSYGLNVNQPLERQQCLMTDDGWNWQQYFLSLALKDWEMYNALYQEAEAVGFESTVDMDEYLEQMKVSLQDAATSQNYASVEEMVTHDMGAGASVDAYLDYLKIVQVGYEYYQYMYDNLVPTDDQARAYYEENIEKFEESGAIDDGSLFVDARHILIKTTDTSDEAAWAAAEKKAQALMDQWLAGDMTEETFAAMANEHSDDTGSNTNGGLYTFIREGEMLQAFSDWCFKESHQPGDYGLVKTQIGYHLIYYVQDQPVWLVYAKNSAKTQLANENIEAIIEKFAANVDYSKIVLGAVDQSGEDASAKATEAAK